MYEPGFFGDLQSDVIFSQGWEAAKNVLITWFSIAEKQDNLYQVYAAPALTNKRAAFIRVFNQNLAPI